MKESADKKLKERIIEVFDNYDDSGAEQGWLELRKKYPENPARSRLLWWSSVAALLAVGISFFLINTSRQDQNTISQYKSKPAADSMVIPSGSDLVKEKAVPTPKLTAKTPNPSVSRPVLKAPVSDYIVPDHIPAATLSADETIADNQKQQAPLPASINDHSDRYTPASPAITDTVAKNAADAIIADIPYSRAKHQALPLETHKISGKDEESRGVELSFYAGPFLNYAEGSSSTVNLGAGVTSGISLNKRLTLITGVALAKNTLIFTDNKLPAASYSAFAADNTPQHSSLVGGNVPQISRFEAQLLNLDIPVNLKYSLSRDPGKVFITAGLSSFTYLNEAYSYSYTNLISGAAASPPQKEVIRNFGKVDLAQTLNVSVGVTHSAKFNDIVIEPFIKYPLSTLGSQDIRFGSAGINLKLSIKPGAGKD